MYIGTVFTAIFGGKFSGSLISFSLLTILCFAGISYFIGKAIFAKKTTALAITNIILTILLIQPIFLTNVFGTNDIYKALISVLGPGNSARFVRGLIVPIVIFIVILFLKNIDIIKKKNKYIENNITIFTDIVIGFIAGFCFLWSNDYGISSWLCLLIMYFLYIISKKEKFISKIKNIILVILSSFLGIAIFAEIFTLGHINQWINSTFMTGGYQGWYYLNSGGFYIFDIDLSPIMLIQAFLCIYYLVILFRNGFSKLNIEKYGVLAFINMVSFCAVNEYHLLSGGNSSREVAITVLFCTVFYELIHKVEKKMALNNKSLIIVSIALSLSYIIYSTKNEFIFCNFTTKEGEYIEEMGGYMTSLSSDIKRTKKFLGNERFFSTYASAQEVMNNTFQPSGIDYNIHVLGDQQRIDYMNSFKNDDFRYTITIQNHYTEWQIWNERANWYFYRELYKNWHPVYENAYAVIWDRNYNEKQNTIHKEYLININEINETTTRISIQTDTNINGIADVLIDYEIKKKDNMQSKFLFKRLLKTENTGNSRGSLDKTLLRSKSREFVPIPIVNGYGELTLSSLPAEATYLKLNEVLCNEIFTILYDKLPLTVADLSDQNWENGVLKTDRRVLLFVNTKRVLEYIQTSEFIVCDGEKFKIDKYEIFDSWIHLHVDRDASICAFPGILTVE